MFSKQAVVAALSLVLAASAQAGVVVSAQSATILSGGPGFGNINDTFNLFGLETDYISGVTDFATYFAGNPQHTTIFDETPNDGVQGDYEWFSNSGITSASVSYDLGSVITTQGLALWNEDAAGIGKLNILGSVNGTTWFTLASNLSPTNNPLDTTTQGTYGADLFNWTATATRYIRLDMSSCPQPGGDGFLGCSIGEVAFHSTSVVPETSTLSMGLLGLGLVGVALARRRRMD